MIIKSISPLSMAKLSGALYAAIGLLLGGFFALISVIGSGLSSNELGLGQWGIGFGLAGIILFPILYGVIGFVIGLLTSLFYNLFAHLVGGVEVTVEMN